MASESKGKLYHSFSSALSINELKSTLAFVLAGKRAKIREEVKDLIDGGMSVREASVVVASHHDMSDNTVRSDYIRNNKSPERSHGNQMLSNLEEAVLVGVCVSCASAGIPLDRKQLLDLVRVEHSHSKLGFKIRVWRLRSLMFFCLSCRCNLGRYIVVSWILLPVEPCNQIWSHKGN